MKPCSKCRDDAIGYYGLRWWCVLCAPEALLEALHKKDARDKANAKRRLTNTR